jgi:hypothetical protein
MHNLSLFNRRLSRTNLGRFSDDVGLCEAVLVTKWEGYDLSLHDTESHGDIHRYYARLWRDGVMVPVKISTTSDPKWPDPKNCDVSIALICNYLQMPWIVYKRHGAQFHTRGVLHRDRDLLGPRQSISHGFGQYTKSTSIQVLNNVPVGVVRSGTSDLVLLGDQIITPPGSMNPGSAEYSCQLEGADSGPNKSKGFGFLDGKLVYAYCIISDFGCAEDGVHPTVERSALVVGDNYFDELHSWHFDRDHRLLATMGVSGRIAHVEVGPSGPVRIDEFLDDRQIINIRRFPHARKFIYMTRDELGQIWVQTQNGAQLVEDELPEHGFFMDTAQFKGRTIAHIRSIYEGRRILARVRIP